jgi:hypothetical protein
MRTFLAFLVAPLWVVAAVGLLAVVITTPHPWQDPWMYSIVATGAIYGYGGTVIIGVPAFYILRARGYTALRVALATGFAAGVLTWLGFLAAISVLLHAAVDHLLVGFATSPRSLAFWVAGLLGAVVGATIWLIARPDR